MPPAVPKIVIRARPSSTRNATASSAAPTPTPEAESEREEDPEDEGDIEDENAMDVDQEESPGLADDSAQQEGALESLAGTPAPRKRGRPPGSKKIPSGATGTPRARGRGRGRARGRGRGAGGSFMIRLPKRADDDTEADADVEGDVEADVEGGNGTPVEGDVEGEKEVVPIGRGKPFRNIQGAVYVIDGDEFVTDDDPKGDEKIDKYGNLLGGRRFKAATFILPNRHPQRQYMLAIDAARTSGFRDSLYYFRRNLLALKLNATQPEKEYLISEGKLGSHLRTRSVTLVTARSAFKLHGSKMILDGRWVTDDYYEDKVLADITTRGLKAGDPVGDLPDPNAAHHNNELSALNAAAAANSNKNERGGGGGGGLYRAGGPTTIFGGSGWGPYSDGPLNAVRKSLLSRDGVTEENWMWMMATRVSEANEGWAKQRREAVKSVESLIGVAPTVSVSLSSQPPVVVKAPKDDEEEEVGDVNQTDDAAKPKPKKRKVAFEQNTPILGAYEPHTNIIQYRSDTQPTSCRWEVLPDTVEKRRVLGGTKTGNGAWALAWVDTVMEFPDPEIQEKQSADAQARERLWRDVDRAGEADVVDLT